MEMIGQSLQSCKQIGVNNLVSDQQILIHLLVPGFLGHRLYECVHFQRARCGSPFECLHPIECGRVSKMIPMHGILN